MFVRSAAPGIEGELFLSSKQALRGDYIVSDVSREVVGRAQSKQLVQSAPRAINAALDRANRTARNDRCLLVRESFGPDQNQCLALIGRQLLQGNAEVLEIHMAELLGANRYLGRKVAVGIFDFSSALAMLRKEKITKDREQPSLQVRARFLPPK